ncbi:MAG TPA: HPr family phosphocarrier protein [Candidatus Binataceae bacterium]|nr:HPr family phosphocarrier protein [Candidatus Binataceae bacterium]
MAEANLEIKNRLGLHLRAASTLAQALKPFTSTVTLEMDGRKANARSVVNLITLGAGIGTKLHVKVEGADAEATLKAVRDLFEQRFGED